MPWSEGYVWAWEGGTIGTQQMNELRQDTSKFSWYNIPTKMLYDPSPYNDPGDPGHDMRQYMVGST